MAQTPEQKARRTAQRKLAQRIKRGESPLGGEFREIVQRAQGTPVTPPPPIAPIETPGIDYVGDEESIAADMFARGTGTGEGAHQQIPLTYRPTNTSYPDRLPKNRHPRTQAAGYNRQTQTLAVKFYTPANLYFYFGVSPQMARAFRLADSPGDYINDVLNAQPYERII